ncbi:MAG: ATP-binding protein, partial [Thermodesulfobacteriota bacterium]
LIRHGMRESHALQILERIQAGTREGRDDRAEFQERLRLYLCRLARVSAPLASVGDHPKVLALVGPTGVGKTTTAAKLAAHCSMGEGRKVAMITNDTYRVAAVEQLRAYAKIMGVEFRVVFQPGDLSRVLEELAEKEVIIMDTAGLNPFDALQMAGLKELVTADPRVSAVLVVSANGDPQGLERVVQEFSILNPVALIGTKLDEAIHFGGLFSLSIQSRLPFAYFTHGQKVPEDIRQASREDMAAWTIFGIPCLCTPAATRDLG